MSDGPGQKPREQPHENPHVRSEEDRISTGNLVFVGVGALVLFFIASFVTISYLRLREGDRPPLPVPPEIGQSKIGMVEQQIFDLATRGQQQRATQLDRLRTYGWVDRQAGVVHLPIERAMELVQEGVRAAPPAPARPRRPEGQP